MRFHVVGKGKLLVLVSQHRPVQQVQDQILRHPNVASLLHAADLRGNSLADLNLEMHRPAVPAERMLTGKAMELIHRLDGHTNRTRVGAIGRWGHGLERHFCTGARNGNTCWNRTAHWKEHCTRTTTAGNQQGRNDGSGRSRCHNNRWGSFDTGTH